MSFHSQLAAGWSTSGSLLCVGLDPDPATFPDPVPRDAGGIVEFCSAIIEATAPLACAYKPQFAHFAAAGAEYALEQVCAAVRRLAPHAALVLDAKRGDVPSTAEFYAREAFERYGADAVTVNPYLGTDAAEPFLRRGGVLALCRTSNAGGADIQGLTASDGRPLYLHVAEMVAHRWRELGECGLVVGATYPEELAAVRDTVGDLPILLPGVGAQGGDLTASIRAGIDSAGTGLMASSSRAILTAGTGAEYADAARRVAEETVRSIDAARAAVATR